MGTRPSPDGFRAVRSKGERPSPVIRLKTRRRPVAFFMPRLLRKVSDVSAYVSGLRGEDSIVELCQEIFNIRRTQRNAMISPNSVGGHFSRVAEPFQTQQIARYIHR